MTEIVERLRGKFLVGSVDDSLDPLLQEAANEIERLRKDNIAIVLSAQANDGQAAALLKQNAALRAALERIVAEAESDDGLTAWDGGDIARAALTAAK